MKAVISASVRIKEPPRNFELTWASRRSAYRFWNSSRTHFIAVATEETIPLKNLYEMAEFAGLDLRVIGIGRADFSWKNKLIWILDHIKSRRSSSHSFGLGTECFPHMTPEGPSICPEDVVVIIDAYDIALTMSARLLGRSLFHSKTPIIFCGEVAAYPNYAYAYLYPTQDGRPNRYLNGGCYLGPVDYVIEAIETLLLENSISRVGGERAIVLADDQYEWARFYLERPYYIHVESEQKYMLCVFRTGLSVNLQWTGALVVTKVSGEGMHRPILPAIVHFNADIKVKYDMVISKYLLPSIRKILSGMSGKACLQVLWEFWDNIHFLSPLTNSSTPDIIFPHDSSFNSICGRDRIENFIHPLCEKLHSCLAH